MLETETKKVQSDLEQETSNLVLHLLKIEICLRRTKW